MMINNKIISFPEDGPVDPVRARLIQVRGWKDMNQADFCRAIDLGENLWSMIENGKRPASHLSMRKIKDAFSVPFDWMYDGDITEQIPSGLLKYISKNR